MLVKGATGQAIADMVNTLPQMLVGNLLIHKRAHRSLLCLGYMNSPLWTVLWNSRTILWSMKITSKVYFTLFHCHHYNVLLYVIKCGCAYGFASLALSVLFNSFLNCRLYKLIQNQTKPKLDRTRRKASEICLRAPLNIYSHTFSR